MHQRPSDAAWRIDPQRYQFSQIMASLAVNGPMRRSWMCICQARKVPKITISAAQSQMYTSPVLMAVIRAAAAVQTFPMNMTLGLWNSDSTSAA